MSTTDRISPLGNWEPPPFVVALSLEHIEAYKDIPTSEIETINWRSISNEIHDMLQAYAVAVSMFDESRTCSVASYGAIIRHERLSKLIYDYPEARWDIFVAVEESDSYLSPSVKLLAAMIRREAVRQCVQYCPKDP